MSTRLNPVQFGRDVIDQFGRYLLTSFPIADERMETQVRDALRHEVGGERLIAKGPYVHLNRPFESGPSVAALCAEASLGLHAGLADVFPFDSVHKHQELALRAARQGKHVVVATGTGSGKTEAFLLPIVDHCLKLRDEGAPDGVAAIIVYPMNALADDQLRRLRPLLAGTRIAFGRYTGATPSERPGDARQLDHSRPYAPNELQLLAEGQGAEVPLPWEECVSRAEIRERRPRILLTNYAQLEYLLLRDRDLNLFRGAPLRFFVFDEVHSYTGALGSEVACLIRRLRHVVGKTPGEVLCVGTSATVQEADAELDAAEATLSFAHRLFGVPRDELELVQEHYRAPLPESADRFVPVPPSAPRELLAELLDGVSALHRQDEVHELPPGVVELAERLVGRAATGATSMDQVRSLLTGNDIVGTLAETFAEPTLLGPGLDAFRPFGRANCADDDLVAELLAYLTLGALVLVDGEPLLRPKLHYFAQGFQGLACVFPDSGRPDVVFDAAPGHDEEGRRIFPIVLCRSCGQHYLALVSDGAHAADDGGRVTNVEVTRLPTAGEELNDEDESLIYVTDRLVGLSEDVEELPGSRYLCSRCGALHGADGGRCLGPKCGHQGRLVPVLRMPGPMKRCAACDTWAKGYDEIVTPAKSSEVADVTILGQSMLAGMPEEALQKLLVFTDSRQEAAFQAGWMEERSRRFRLRHVLYAVLDEDPTAIRSLEALRNRIVDEAVSRGILLDRPFDIEKNETRVDWFLLEEFASTGQRRNSLETLALARVEFAGIAPEDAPGFYGEWAGRLGLAPAELASVVRLVVDYYRRRGLLSHPLMQRMWSYRDSEVRQGLVQTHDQYRPQALVSEKSGQNSFLKGWTARNGRSGAQEILRKSIPGGKKLKGEVRDAFLHDLWDWLKGGAGLLVPVDLVTKRAGKLEPLRGVHGTLYQLNHEHVGIRLTETRFVCPACRRAQAVAPPTGACPEYGCSGILSEEGRPQDHFDVVQYTKTRFVPLRTWEHTAQVPKEKREEIEREFKKETGGRFNCLVCTPTLEMGVDIGKLEMVLMRNVPPTPANYAQRAGRAGRRHRIAVVFTYCSQSAHDRYFFADPRAMISGEIRVPAFSMRNDPLIRKHVHSTILTDLRAGADEGLGQVLENTFPSFVAGWFTRRWFDESNKAWKPAWLKKPPAFDEYEAAISARQERLLQVGGSVFGEAWPADDMEAVGPEAIAQAVAGAAPRLRRHVHRLYDRVQSYRDEVSALRRTEDERPLTKAEEAQLRRLRTALNALKSEDRLANYGLSWLSVDGYFPGYAMTRDSVRAYSLDPFLEVSRPSTIALRELTPANFVYANKNVFRPRKLHLQQSVGEDGSPGETLDCRLRWHADPERLELTEQQKTEGGAGASAVEVASYRLAEVQLRREQDIDDREKGRRRVGFSILGLLLEQHSGGVRGKLGNRDCSFLRKQHLRLVNLGMPRRKSGTFSLFPVCTVCGEVRSPRASEGELERFGEAHLKSCQRLPGDIALHVDLESDVLKIGPFEDESEPANLIEAIRIGARHVLDMGTTEIEGIRLADSSGGHWAILYDPMPGGSGFLPQIIELWTVVAGKAREVLGACPSECETSCYSCMRHFRNQRDHTSLDRNRAVELLAETATAFERLHRIEPVHRQHAGDEGKGDSDAEMDFGELCKKYGVQVPPEQQFVVDLGNGKTSIADWAYPASKVLVYIDGMSKGLHGDPAQMQKDRLTRARLKMLGWNVLAMTAEDLKDEVALGMHLEELGIYLGAYVDEPPLASAPASGTEHDKFLLKLYGASTDDKIAALDLIFELVDELLERGAYTSVDSLMDEVDLKRLDADLVVAFLTSTLAAKDRLRRREQLLERAHARLRALVPDRAHSLIKKLR